MNNQISRLKLSVIGQALNGAVSFFGVALWARNSSSSDLATIFITLSIMAILIDLFDFGGSAWATRELVYSKLNSNIVWNFLLNKIRILIVLLLIISIVLLYRGLYPIFVLFVATYSLYILSIGYFQGFCLTQDKYFESFFAQFLERIFWIFPIGLLEFVTDPLICIEISLIIGSSLSVIYILVMMFRYSRERNSQAHVRYNFLDTYKLSKKLGFGSVISDLYSLDTFLVQNFSNAIQAGGYSLIQKNRNFAVLGFAVFGSKLRLAVSESKKSSRKLFQDDWHILILNMMALIFAFIFAPRIVIFFYGIEYLFLIPVLRIGIIIFICVGLSILLQAYISGIKDDGFLAIFSGLSTVLSLVSISLGANYAGAIGASTGLLLSFLLQINILSIRLRILSME